VVALERGWQAAVGTFHGTTMVAVSSGIGGPSLEFVLNQLVELGVRTVIRVGTTGSLHADLACGTLVVNDASVRLDGTSDLYVRPAFPAAAAPEVTMALAEAAAGLGHPVRVGTGATAASFYAGQEREAAGGFRSAVTVGLLDELRRCGVLNLEMEAATLFTLGRLLGLRTGAVCAVVANRETGAWEHDLGVPESCRVASLALHRLAHAPGPFAGGARS
jgi:uridine phosphorylase